MTPMKDYIKVEVTDDADAVTSELYVENTIENPAWYTVDDNHVSLISENVEKVIKLETDMLDDCMWESRIEISKDVANQNNVKLPLESQGIPVNNTDLNYENTNNKIFYCNICEKSFALNYLLKNHLTEHKRQVNFKCKYCEKQFKLKFGLNRHVQKYHNHKYECKFCKLFIDKSIYNEHMKSHEKNETRIDIIPNIKLRKLNGVWKSKTNIFKCNICFQKCHSEKNLVEHMETHDNCQTQCSDCLKYVSVSELNNHMQQLHNKHLFKCQNCNLQFEKQTHLNCHLIHCLKTPHTKWNEVCGKFKANSTTCSACGIVFNSSLSLKNHMTIGCKHYTCKYCGQLFSSRTLWLRHVDVHEKDEQREMLAVNNDKTTAIREHNQTEVVNDSSFNTNEVHLLSRNVTGRNSSDQRDLVNSNESTKHIASLCNFVVNDINLNINKEKNVCTTVEKRRKSYDKEAVNSNESITQNIPHNLMADGSNTNLNQNKISLNIIKKNSSGRIGLMNSSATIVSTTSNNSMAHDCCIQNIKQEKYSDADFNERNISHQIINNQPTVSVSPQHNSITNNGIVLNIKQEKNVCIINKETNSSDQINLANGNESIISPVSHNSMVNNYHVLNIKQEKNTSTNVRERNSFDQMDFVNSNEPTVVNKPIDLMAYQNPISIANNNNASTVRETPYFCIRKLPNIKNVFCNDNYEQTSQNNVIFICRICKKSPSTDIHSFALHMSDHSECNMHECIVCDKTFNTVLLWTNHMTYHQQQLDLNVSAVQFNSIEIKSNTLDSINSENKESQNCSTSRNKKLKISSSDSSYSSITNLNNSGNIKNQYNCSTCKKLFPSKITLKVHQTLHNKSKSFSCRYCNRIFSGKGQCTNHEKSHIGLDNLFLQNNENNKSEAVEIQNNINMENNNIDSETMSIKHKNKNKLLSTKKKNFCNLCNRKFTKRCYFTNHMQLKHNINPNLPKPFTSVDCKKLIIPSENIQLTNEYENKLLISVDNDLNNHVNKSNEKKSTVCTICNKQFGHLGALTNHMSIHLDRKPYKCQYCSRKFSREGPYIMHEKKHVLKNEVKSASNLNTNNITIEDNEVPQIENCDDFELVHNPVDGNSNGTNLTNLKHLWFTCDVCEKKFSTPFQLNVHRKSHSGIVPYVCKICNKSYSLKFRWNWHLKGHYTRHIENLKIKQHTNNLKSNIGKLKIESIHYQDKMKCRYCKKEYNLLSQWKKHMRMSKECRRHCKSNLPEFTSNQASKNFTKSCRFKCNICKKTYSTSYNLSVHMKNVHNELDTTVLNIHNTSFQKDKEMEIVQHNPVIKKRNRSNHINGTKCKLCGKVYSNAANLGRHISIIHTNNYEPMTCNDCGKTFKHKYSYREHLKIKHKRLFKNYEEINYKNKRIDRKNISMNKKIIIMKYFCKICKMKFTDNITLQEHSKIHIVNKYKCKDCGQQFETNVTLGNHILENHSANISTYNKNEHVENYESQNDSLEVINYNPAQCKVCLKILKDPGYLHEHMRLHTGVKPFKCDKCNMAFRFKSNLRMHRKKHLSCYIP